MYAYVCVYIYIYIVFIYLHTSMHACMHAYIHTYIYICLKRKVCGAGPNSRLLERDHLGPYTKSNCTDRGPTCNEPQEPGSHSEGPLQPSDALELLELFVPTCGREHLAYRQLFGHSQWLSFDTLPEGCARCTESCASWGS